MSKTKFDIIEVPCYVRFMARTAKRPFKTRLRRPPAAVEPKATTFRLRPALQVGLEELRRVQKKPLNRLINEAVQALIEKRLAEVEANHQLTIERLKAYRQKDPGFELAIAQFVDAEASLGREDTVEGKSPPTAGPAQTMIHELLRG
jgi:hypothetical protein